MTAIERIRIPLKVPELHINQQIAWDYYIARSRRVVLRCGRRWGKALAIETPIPTPDGWCQIGALKVGDLVFSEVGEICRVVATTGVMFDRPCREMKFSDGSSIIADDEHQWLTWERYARKNRKRGGKMNAMPRIRTSAIIAASMTTGGRGDINHSIAPCAPIEGPQIAFPISAYVLGIWLGDGTSATANLTCADSQIIDEIRLEGQPVHKIAARYSWRLGRRKIDYVRGEESLQERLRRCGLLDNKHIPPAFFRAAASQRLALIQGLMDTDGYVSKDGHCEFTSVDKGLAEGALELFRTFGIRAVLFTGRATINGKDCGIKYRVRFTTLLPVFRLRRKLDRLSARQTERNIEHRFIVSAERVESIPVCCIEVDSPSRLYLAGRAFIPTHNSTLNVAAAISIAGARRLPVGWFAPEVKHFAQQYRECLYGLKSHLVARQHNAFIHTLGGGSIDFWSLENQLAGLGRKYAFVIIDEAHSAKDNMGDMWSLNIEPTLFDYAGSALVTSNTKGNRPDSWFWQICHDKSLGWAEFHATTNDNPLLPIRLRDESDAEWIKRRDVERADLVRKTDPRVYLQEYLADWVSWDGLAFFSEDKLLHEGKPVHVPTHSDYVFATIDTAIKTKRENDGTGVVYWSYNRFGLPDTWKLSILDWEYEQIEGASLERWLPNVFKRLEEFAVQCHSRYGSSGAFIEDKGSGSILLQQAQARGWQAHALDIGLTDVGKSERAISVSSYVHRDLVKITEHAFNRTDIYKGVNRNHLLSQITQFRIGSKEEVDDDLADCFTYGIAISLGNSEGI